MQQQQQEEELPQQAAAGGAATAAAGQAAAVGSPTVLDVQPLLKDDLARVRIVFQSDELPVFRLRTADMDDPLWRWNVASRGLGPTPEEYADALRVLRGLRTPRPLSACYYDGV